jgi:hypothetical protein
MKVAACHCPVESVRSAPTQPRSAACLPSWFASELPISNCGGNYRLPACVRCPLCLALRPLAGTWSVSDGPTSPVAILPPTTMMARNRERSHSARSRGARWRVQRPDRTDDPATCAPLACVRSMCRAGTAIGPITCRCRPSAPAWSAANAASSARTRGRPGVPYGGPTCPGPASAGLKEKRSRHPRARLRSAYRTQQTQLCITSQDQAAARSAAHTLSASARVSVAARARTAPVSPTMPRTTKCGSRPPRIAEYFACTSR